MVFAQMHTLARTVVRGNTLALPGLSYWVEVFLHCIPCANRPRCFVTLFTKLKQTLTSSRSSQAFERRSHGRWGLSLRVHDRTAQSHIACSSRAANEQVSCDACLLIYTHLHTHTHAQTRACTHTYKRTRTQSHAHHAPNITYQSLISCSNKQKFAPAADSGRRTRAPTLISGHTSGTSTGRALAWPSFRSSTRLSVPVRRLMRLRRWPRHPLLLANHTRRMCLPRHLVQRKSIALHFQHCLMMLKCAFMSLRLCGCE